MVTVATAPASTVGTIDRFFGISARGSNLRTELLAGTTTFLAMAYIIFVHPGILANTGMDRNALIAVTCLVSAIATIVTGLVGRAPIAMAPGMGLNAFFTFVLVLGLGLPWQTALGLVFLSGLVTLLLVLLGVRQAFVNAIPRSLVAAISVGIGLFITFIGLINLGLVVRNEATIVGAGPITGTVLIGLVGLIVILALEARRIKGAMLVGILLATAIAILAGLVPAPAAFTSAAIDIRPIAFQLNVAAALQGSLIVIVFTLLFVDLFDSIGTLVACTQEAGLVREDGSIQGLNRLLILDSCATMFGALLGTSTTTSFIESAAGIEEGGRTGLTSVVTGLWFLLAMLFIPIIALVPAYATAPALILVGMYMARQVTTIDFSRIDEAMPAFIIFVMIALSYSISSGLAFGFLSYVILKTVTGNIRHVHPVMWGIAALSLAHFLFPV